MASEDSDQSRTEAPTPRRREEAREQGQVAYSAELATGLILIAALAMLSMLGPTLGQGLLEVVQSDLQRRPYQEMDEIEAQRLLGGVFSKALTLTGWILTSQVAAILGAALLQVGFHLVPALAGLKLERLDLAQGWTRLFSRAAVFRGLAALLKVAVVVIVAYVVLRNRMGMVADVGDLRLSEVLSRGWGLLAMVSMTSAGALVLLGAADYGWQLWRHEQSLRMTREELKDELKRDEGDPQIKARVRKLQREASRQRMLLDVPKATVVITNPTHLAVALSYERGSMHAPRIAAKGAGAMAKRIVEIARRHAVPVVERKPVAQALFKTVKVGQEVPLGLYQVVAEVLAYVYRLRGHAA